MKISRKVKEILSHYESDNPGTKANLARILMEGRLGGSGKLLILPVDQGFEHGPARSFAPNPPAYDPHYHFQLAVDAGLSAFAAPLGMIEAGADSFAGAIPTILKVNSSNSLAKAKDQAVTGSVNDALRLGCAAIGFTIYPGSDYAFEMMEEIRQLAEEAKAAGLAVVIWSYPRGDALSKEGETAMDICAYAAHMAALLGAHIIKVKPPTAFLEQPEAKKVYEKEKIPIATLADRIRNVVQSCFNGRRIVVFLRRCREGSRRHLRGGPRHPRRRRQRLDHRPQHLPAPARGRAEDARPADQDLRRQGVSRHRRRPALPALSDDAARTGFGRRSFARFPPALRARPSGGGRRLPADRLPGRGRRRCAGGGRLAADFAGPGARRGGAPAGPCGAGPESGCRRRTPRLPRDGARRRAPPLSLRPQDNQRGRHRRGVLPAGAPCGDGTGGSRRRLCRLRLRFA